MAATITHHSDAVPPTHHSSSSHSYSSLTVSAHHHHHHSSSSSSSSSGSGHGGNGTSISGHIGHGHMGGHELLRHDTHISPPPTDVLADTSANGTSEIVRHGPQYRQLRLIAGYSPLAVSLPVLLVSCSHSLCSSPIIKWLFGCTNRAN